ncbi:hypothetical protein FLBR109950_06015 [Flavobacterium branchiophilum]|uniref:Rieske domain-containing protein n=2 Tax=Flavobacterium branchiophilum TaxID=55197 RepID=G2Z4H3_FLABF|nr:hypothetical protein [Flavobacterium branchiophilum]PDS24477.1 hypothetical protein B0A77_08060 [Flavobacterium branchiophilum]CCB68448.1 Protein of unknown function [Flavobacterium branchiophilum FL-15]
MMVFRKLIEHITSSFYKKIVVFIFIGCLFSCSKETINNNNPYLPNYTFTYNVDLNLPSHSNLQFAGNGITVTTQGVGVRGVFVFNTGSGYTAWDMACPNQSLSSCSTMTLSGINAVCPCDDKKYSLYTGQSAGMTYPLKAYRVEVNGTVLRIYN